MEWSNLRKIYTKCFIRFDLELLVSSIEDVIFIWKYHDNLASVFYKPSKVFKKSAFIHLLDSNNVCMCLQAKRFGKFLDSQTL